jgi:broad specificity phosphatase PhoE
MKRFSVVFCIFLLLIAAAQGAPIVFVVRHTEKATTGGDNPDLSVAGHKRADALARILQDSQITAIFVTEFKRTQETAAPTAKETHITPTIVPSTDIAGLAVKLRAVNGNALVVGHGNTIPDLMKALGIAIPINIPDADYTEIFVVSLSDPPQLLRLHYPF